jgi:hypothetical protein
MTSRASVLQCGVHDVSQPRAHGDALAGCLLAKLVNIGDKKPPSNGLCDL